MNTKTKWLAKIRSVKTPPGRIPEKEVDRFLYRANEVAELSEPRRDFRRTSERNQLVGRVTDVKVDGLIAQVTQSLVDHHRRCSSGNAPRIWSDLGRSDQVNRSDDYSDESFDSLAVGFSRLPRLQFNVVHPFEH